MIIVAILQVIQRGVWLFALILLLTGCIGSTPSSTAKRIAVIASGESRVIKMDGLRDGLISRGYTIGTNLYLDLYDAGNEGDRIAEYVQRALATEPDIVVTLGGIETQAALEQAAGIPIVFIGVAHTLEWGLVDSIQSPGDGITGIDNGYVELTGKRLEWAQRLLPQANHMTALYSQRIIPSEAALAEGTQMAALLDLTLNPYDINSRPQHMPLADDFTTFDTDALVIMPSHVIENWIGEVVMAALAARLPVIGLSVDATESGALISYGASFYDMGFQASRLVDKVLHGIAPENIPVEFPDRPELSVNLSTAESLGLTMPPDLLLLADRVVP